MPRKTHVAATAKTFVLSWLAVSTAHAQPLALTRDSNTNSSNTRPVIAPALPTPPIPSADPPDLFLMSARQSVESGRTGEAQEALERAETRLLDTAASPSQAAVPSRKPAVLAVASARRALAARDWVAAVAAIDDALSAIRPFSPVTPLQAAPPADAPRIVDVPGPVVSDAAAAAPLPMPTSVITRGLSPGHWALDGAQYVWVGPERTLRRAEAVERVPSVYVWREGAYVWVPTHHAQ